MILIWTRFCKCLKVLRCPRLHFFRIESNVWLHYVHRGIRQEFNILGKSCCFLGNETISMFIRGKYVHTNSKKIGSCLGHNPISHRSHVAGQVKMKPLRCPSVCLVCKTFWAKMKSSPGSLSIMTSNKKLENEGCKHCWALNENEGPVSVSEKSELCHVPSATSR